METQNSYKRTVAGSVGAGVGAIFNGSGRTYYILEHKTSSKYHSAGESQKIIIDQVELGRDASCQVRFDESFETVSRKHAAIVRDGNNWQLVHLSNSNPTLVNGRPIQGVYYLQSGDEIQLSEGGPRLGFIQPQGRQGLTSSIRLTERMNLFRQQALRPYRRAIWALSILVVLVALGFGAWNYKLGLDNKALRHEMALYQAQVDSLGFEKARLDEMEQRLTEQLAANPDNQDLKAQLGEVQKERVRVVYAYNTASQKLASTKAVYKFDEEEDTEVRASSMQVNDSELHGEVTEPVSQTMRENSASSTNSSDNIVSYYNDIYTLKVKRITVERDGRSHDPGIAVSDIVVGTGFVVDGKFITARSNLQPWVYTEYYNEDWRLRLAEYAAAKFKVIIDYEAYSTRGSGHPLRFSNTQFNLQALEAYDEMKITEIRKTIVKQIRAWGYEFKYTKNTYSLYKRPVLTAQSYNAGSLALGAPGGLPIDMGMAQSLKGSEEVVIAGFSGTTDIQNPSAYVKYFTSKTSRVANMFITLQDTHNNWGFTGAPAFYKEQDGSYRVVGVNVGNFNSEVRVVPINRVR